MHTLREMNNYSASQLAEARRRDLIAAATYHRQSRGHRRRMGNRTRGPLAAFYTWLAAGQL